MEGPDESFVYVVEVIGEMVVVDKYDGGSGYIGGLVL